MDFSYAVGPRTTLILVTRKISVLQEQCTYYELLYTGRFYDFVLIAVIIHVQIYVSISNLYRNVVGFLSIQGVYKYPRAFTNTLGCL